MSRRGKGEGSIRLRKDGRWEARLAVPGATGRGRRSYFGQTRSEVAKKLAAALKATDDGLSLPSDRVSVKSYLEQWLAAKQPSLRPESYRRYGDAVRLHLVPELGTTPINKLSPVQVQGAYARLRDKGLSGTTLQLIHGVLHTALDDAAKWDVVTRNVTDLVDAPRRTTREMDALSPSEALRLLDAAKSDPLEAFYATALTTGLRLGELQALRWRDVNLDRRTLQVVFTYQGTENGQPVFSEPKTARSRRGVQLSTMAADALRRHKASQAEARLKAGPAWQDFGLVFTNGIGRPLDGNNLRKRSFAQLLERAGLQPMRFHALRHAAATLLMSEGVPVKAISEMLGHSDVTTTLRIYAHVLPTSHDQAANAMDRLFGEL